MKNPSVRRLAVSAVLAAVYAALTISTGFMSYGGVQFRIAEALGVLPFFFPVTTWGLFIGCLIANVLGGGIILDVIAGSIATLIAAVATYLLRGKSKYLASVPPVVANALIVPWVLKYGYGEPLSIPFMMGTVGLGEILTATIVGTILLLVLERYRSHIFKTA